MGNRRFSNMTNAEFMSAYKRQWFTHLQTTKMGEWSKELLSRLEVADIKVRHNIKRTRIRMSDNNQPELFGVNTDGIEN